MEPDDLLCTLYWDLTVISSKCLNGDWKDYRIGTTPRHLATKSDLRPSPANDSYAWLFLLLVLDRLGVLETWVLVSRHLKTEFWRSGSSSWGLKSWSWCLESQFWSCRSLVLVSRLVWWLLNTKYEGHPINKLLNSIILLIFKMWKIWDIRFVGNLFLHKTCEFHYDDVTVTSVIYIKYRDVTIKIIPRRAAFYYSFSLGERI